MITRRMKVTLQPEVLRWARERASLGPDELAAKMQVKPERVVEWERSGSISMAQVGKLARHTHTPEGNLFLDEPPDDSLPIADFRTPGDQPLPLPSPNLLDTVYSMQHRQFWMRDELVLDEAAPLEFVGAFNNSTDSEEVAHGIREVLALESAWASRNPTWASALRFLRDRIEEAGVLVFVNGIVGNNTHRKLDPDEFRGFALIDSYVPLIFINNADYTSAQMFTLAHELAHVFVGLEGVSNFEAYLPFPHPDEQFCNRVAAEFLVPREDIEDFWETVKGDAELYQKIALEFKVSVIVAARRALDLDLIDRTDYFDFYDKYLADERRRKDKSPGGGDFWNNQSVRLGWRFGPAVARSVKEGRTLYREAYSLTGLNGETFNRFLDWASESV